MSDTDEHPDITRLKKAVEALSEHYDSVQIFATRHEDGDEGTTNVSWGCGNWFARYGYCKEWITKQEEMTKERARKEND